MKTASRFPTGYPSPLGFYVSLFGRVSKSYPGRGGSSPRAGRVHPVWTRVYEGRAGPHQSERSERAWTMAVRVALAGAAAGRLDGLTVHRSPCRWLGVRLCCAALGVSDDLVSLGCVVGTDCGRPPPGLTNTYEMRNPQPSLGFYGDLLGDPGLSRVLKPPCVTVCRGMSPFTRDLFLISEAAQPPSRPAYASGGAELPLNRRGHVVERLLGLDAIAPSSGCGSPEGGRYCRLGAHRRPMPGGRLVRMDCSSACRSLALFEQLLTSCCLF